MMIFVCFTHPFSLQFKIAKRGEVRWNKKERFSKTRNRKRQIIKFYKFIIMK